MICLAIHVCIFGVSLIAGLEYGTRDTYIFSKSFTPVKYKCHMILHLAFELYLAEDQILLFDM